MNRVLEVQERTLIWGKGRAVETEKIPRFWRRACRFFVPTSSNCACERDKPILSEYAGKNELHVLTEVENYLYFTCSRKEKLDTFSG